MKELLSLKNEQFIHDVVPWEMKRLIDRVNEFTNVLVHERFVHDCQ